MNNTYLTYDVTDLAADDQFISWVRSGRPSDTQWSQWILNNPEVRDRVNDAASIVESLKYTEREIPKRQTDELWARINSSINEQDDSKVIKMSRRSSFRFVAYAAAACIALLFAITIFLNSDETITAGAGQSLAHVLPDNSKVNLNAGSEINYNKDDWAKERTLTLTGEAYFEVEKGQKFTVHTNYGDITVLGTSFNIYSRADGFKVHCTSGKVQVIANNKPVILTPDTRTSLVNGILQKEDILENKKVDWLNKIYRFDGIPLRVVFESIERQFDVQVEISETEVERLYTGSYDASDLDQALNTICYSMELIHKSNGKLISISPDEGN